MAEFRTAGGMVVGLLRWMAAGRTAWTGGVLMALVGGLGCGEAAMGREAVSTMRADGAELVEVYAADRFFEGPSWDPAEGKLYFTSFAKDNQQVLRLERPGAVSVWLDRSEGVNGTFRAQDGRLLAAQTYGHRVLSLRLGGDKPGDVRVLAADPAWNQPNDICQTPEGLIFTTDPDFQTRTKSRVLRVNGDGTVTPVIENMQIPNGIVSSLDGRTLYVSDSHAKHWRAYPILPDGAVGPGRVFFDPDTPDRADPDGMTIDVEGNLYCTGRGGVWVVRPDGSLREFIAVPEFVSNVTFGGADGRTLYLTCKGKVYALAMRVRGGATGGWWGNAE